MESGDLKVTDAKTALRRLQQLLDARRQSRSGELVDMMEWKKKREARASERSKRLAEVSGQEDGPERKK